MSFSGASFYLSRLSSIKKKPSQQKNIFLPVIMAALAGLFRTRSIASTSMDNKHERPERIDTVSLEWSRRHRYVVSRTIIGEVEYINRETSLTRINKTQVARAVYLMTTVVATRKLLYSLETELSDHYVGFTKTGLFWDPDMPADLVKFLSADDSVKKRTEFPEKRWTSEQVWTSIEGLIGLLSLAD